MSGIIHCSRCMNETLHVDDLIIMKNIMKSKFGNVLMRRSCGAVPPMLINKDASIAEVTWCWGWVAHWGCRMNGRIQNALQLSLAPCPSGRLMPTEFFD